MPVVSKTRLNKRKMSFADDLARHHFDVQELSYFSKPFSEQQAMFYSAAVPIKILSIKRPADSG